MAEDDTYRAEYLTRPGILPFTVHPRPQSTGTGIQTIPCIKPRPWFSYASRHCSRVCTTPFTQLDSIGVFARVVVFIFIERLETLTVCLIDFHSASFIPWIVAEVTVSENDYYSVNFWKVNPLSYNIDLSSNWM